MKLQSGQSLSGTTGSRGQQSLAENSGEPGDEELKRLRRENQDLKKANYILKQAAAFFSQDHLK